MGAAHFCGDEFRHVAVLECYIDAVAAVSPRVSGDPVHFGKMQSVAVLFFGVVTARHVDYVVVNVFFHHIPGAAAETESLSLADGMEPVAAVFPDFASGLYFNNRAGLFA